MSVGYTITKAGLDSFMGGALVAVRNSLFVCARFKTQQLDDTTLLSSSYMTGTLGYGSGEDTQLRAAFTAMNNLWLISTAVNTQASTNDFWFDAKHLMGTNVA